MDYTMNPTTGIFIADKTGILTLEGIMAHYVELQVNTSLPNTLKVLIDCRKARFDVDINKLASLESHVRESVKRFQYLREAILVDKPYETVVATLFLKIHASLPNYSFRVFSTQEAAQLWL